MRNKPGKSQAVDRSRAATALNRAAGHIQDALHALSQPNLDALTSGELRNWQDHEGYLREDFQALMDTAQAISGTVTGPNGQPVDPSQNHLPKVDYAAIGTRIHQDLASGKGPGGDMEGAAAYLKSQSWTTEAVLRADFNLTPSALDAVLAQFPGHRRRNGIIHLK